jgi:hypothetical protein
LQDLPNHHEEVQQPAIGQRRSDTSCSSPFAELVILDVGMGHVPTARWAVGIDSNYVVGSASADPLPMQDDPKGTEVNVFQNNALCVDADRLLLEIDRHCLKLSCEGQKVSGDDAGCAYFVQRTARRQPSPQGIELSRQAAELVLQIAGYRLGSGSPAAAMHEVKPANQRADFLPLRLRQGDVTSVSLWSTEMLMNPDGSPNCLSLEVLIGAHKRISGEKGLAEASEHLRF